MRPKPTKLSVNQLIGREILKRIDTYEFKKEENSVLPVTAARKYVRENKIKGPAVIHVIRNKFTTDKFYWCDKGMFSAAFAEVNYPNFEELRKISITLIKEGFIADQSELYWGMELREPNYEFMYA